MIDRRLETSNVFHGQIVCVTRFDIFVERSEYLRVEDLELADSVNHAFERDGLDDLVPAVDTLHPQHVVAKVESFEPPLLPQQHD